MTELRNKLVLPGGSGFLGRLLARWFAERGWDIVTLSRRHNDSARYGRTVVWDGKTAGVWTDELEGAAAVVNLAGRSVNCRYHARNRRDIFDSRIQSTQILGAAMARCRRPPRVWLNSSTATIYKHSYDRPMDELTGEIGATAVAKDEFSIEVAKAWEKAFDEAQVPATRKVALRTAMVLGREPGSVFPVLRRLARFGLGGVLGDGRQYVSWIHEVDFCRAVEWLVAHDKIAGPVNLAAPQPLPNRDVMQLFRRICGIPVGLPAAGWMLELGAILLRTETELIIKSRRVVPGRLLEYGFEFQYPRLDLALHELSSRDATERAGVSRSHRAQWPGESVKHACR